MNTENFSQKIKLQKNPHFHKIPSKSISTIKSLLNFPKKKKRWEPIRISSSKKNTRKRERTELSKRDFYSENLRTYLSTLLRIISMIALRPFWEQGHRRKVSEMRQWRKSGGCDRPVFMKRIMAIVVIKYMVRVVVRFDPVRNRMEERGCLWFSCVESLYVLRIWCCLWNASMI